MAHRLRWITVHGASGLLRAVVEEAAQAGVPVAGDHGDCHGDFATREQSDGVEQAQVDVVVIIDIADAQPERWMWVGTDDQNLAGRSQPLAGTNQQVG